MTESLFFILFLVFIVGMLFLDLGVFNKKDHIVSWKEALLWTLAWIGVSLLFYVFVYFRAEWVHGIKDIQGLIKYKQEYAPNLIINTSIPFNENLIVFRKTLSLEFLTSYIIEKTLSIDNIFVILLILTSFKVETKYYHRVLFYGILGAVVLRFIFIFISSSLIHHFHWILLVFGAFLIYSGISMFFEKESKTLDIRNHFLVRFLAKWKLSTPNYHDKKFFKFENGRILATPLFVALLVIEFSDVIFAVDSIPAIFSVTRDPFLVFFSNIFAILGLRSLFFVLQNMVDKFRFLKYGIALLLSFIGIKMILPFIPGVEYEISTPVSLWTILSILVVSIVASLLIKENKISLKQN